MAESNSSRIYYAPSGKPRTAVRHLEGQVFARLTVIERAIPIEDGHQWRCRCVCGTVVVVRQDRMTGGYKRSCGCLLRDASAEAGRNSVSHGATRGGVLTSTYRTWATMKDRVTNPKCPKYRRYGGRGITMDPAWHRFQNFVADMGERPSSELSIDRIDNDGPYTKANCRWATRLEQARNKVAYQKKGMKFLTWDQVAVIRQRISEGERDTAIAPDFGVYPATIQSIRTGKTWKPKAAS